MKESLDTNRPPWQPKGVGAGGGCTPSRMEHGKLKYNTVSVFSISHMINT